ncbi:hypothetical protein NDU88_005016 [Pleurodeles waltl]|uniref:Uncharacterized protein n=1 Tax=Pleurodeles waltl TaxID=8319 RepID=A0AAV7RM36_PLEWA|nr:hypothetical protein NDU88_005016 [Pleurodeles waltl]
MEGISLVGGGPPCTKQSILDKYAQHGGPTSSAGAEGQPQLLPDNTALLAAITHSWDVLKAKIGMMGSEVTLLHQHLPNTVDCTTEAETQVSGGENSVAALKLTVSKLTPATKVLAAHVEDDESRVHRKNLHFISFPEGCKASSVEHFLDLRLHEIMPQEVLSPCFVLEQAYRALVKCPPPGDRTHPIIAKLLNYLEHDAILKHTRLHVPIP